ncbi:lytic transglycosylase domain-containing protein [uncultured Streptomyces sp.]|uniref:lytic transglycosylase domain-containing protein n=1 Tax=uncultured Streptomyces sp. TaxID=174707 RepID=UPI002610ED53|nr:lytic transglycosylase domain-containing protein [uncultured Streptomyces sp.]
MAAQFGRRLRRGATNTAVAAVVVAALAASQAPGAPGADRAGADDPSTASESGPDTAASDGAGDERYYTDLPPLTTPSKPKTSVDLPLTGSAESGIPATVLAAYKQAEADLARTDAACRLPWQLLAAIGKVESGQARGGNVDARGTTLSPILGPALNGQGFALIKDSDGGAYDGDSTHDRAVGPMQFIPQTWATWGQDANGDGRKDPNNIYDAALAAGRYLCAGSRDLGLATDLDRAVLSYNHSTEYLRTVRTWFAYYQDGVHEVPDGTGVLPVTSSGGGRATAGPTPTPGAPASGTSTPGSGPSASPSPSPTPSTPSTPSAPGTPTPTPTLPTVPPPTNPPTPPASSTLGSVVDAGTGALTALTGDAFEGRIAVRALSTTGKAFARTPVTFTIAGDTDARFADGTATATTATGTDGVATAPVIRAGDTTGAFRIVAVVGTGARQLTFTYLATVNARHADALARTGDTALSAATGTEFADRVGIKATRGGAVAAGVAVTATVLTGGLLPVTDDKGPYFEDADGEAVRTLSGLVTDQDGLLTLPVLHAGTAPGTYRLSLVAAGGGTVVVELTVEAPEASASPAASATP